MFNDCIGKTIAIHGKAKPKKVDETNTTEETKAPRKNIQVDIILNDPEDKQVQVIDRNHMETQTNIREMVGNNLEANINYTRLEAFLNKVRNV
jgi:hypothetical protein